MMLGRLLDLNILDDRYLNRLLLHPRLGHMLVQEKNRKVVMAGMNSGKSSISAKLTCNSLDPSGHDEAVKTILVREVFESKTGVVWADYENKVWVETESVLRGRKFDPTQRLGQYEYQELKILVESLNRTNVNDLFCTLEWA